MGMVYVDMDVRVGWPRPSFRYQGIHAPSPVVLGELQDEALLGTITLEALGLVLNPFERTLRPMRMRLAPSVGSTAS